MRNETKKKAGAPQWGGKKKGKLGKSCKIIGTFQWPASGWWIDLPMAGLFWGDSPATGGSWKETCKRPTTTNVKNKRKLRRGAEIILPMPPHETGTGRFLRGFGGVHVDTHLRQGT